MNQYKIKVKTSMIFEFIVLMDGVANYEMLLKIQKKSSPLDLRPVIENVEKLRNQLPTLLYEDIKLLFKEFALSHALFVIVEEDLEIPIEAAIIKIKETPAQTFYEALLNGMYGIKDGKDEASVKEKVNDFQNQSMDMILTYKKLLSLKQDLDTIKRRLDLCLDAFYPYFKKLEKTLAFEMSIVADFFEEASQDSESFFKQLDYVNMASFEPLDPHIDLIASVNHIGISYHFEEKDEKREHNQLKIFIGGVNRFLFQDEDLFKLRLKCLADESKMAILLSVKNEPLFAKQLCEKTGLTKGTISHHIEKLLMAKLIEAKKIEGRCVYYGLREGTIEEISQKILETFE